jgi:hypothetical protein
LEGAVAGVDVAIGGDDLAEGVVAPEPARKRWVSAAAGGDSGALADDVHGIVVTGNDGAANFVLLDIEDVAVWLVGVDDGVDWAGDTCEEVAIGEIEVGEELTGDERI